MICSAPSDPNCRFDMTDIPSLYGQWNSGPSASAMNVEEVIQARALNRLVHRTDVPAYSGRALRARRGQVLRIVNVEGGQIGDFFALNPDDELEHLSPSETRSVLLRAFPRVGQAFQSNHRRPMLSLVEDYAAGVHDMMFHACSKEFYASLGAGPNHRNCKDNFQQAVTALLGRQIPAHDPVNLFQNSPLASNGTFLLEPNLARAGDFVKLRVEMDLVCVLTSCCWDLDAVHSQCRPLSIEVFE
jgi:uncharacterized protein YcgI (DUF1989 family)